MALLSSGLRGLPGLRETLVRLYVATNFFDLFGN